MIERYLVVAGRIRQEVANLERVITRAERAVVVARQRPEDQDLYLDAAALNLHDFYAGLERVLHHIAATVDRSVPDGSDTPYSPHPSRYVTTLLTRMFGTARLWRWLTV